MVSWLTADVFSASPFKTSNPGPAISSASFVNAALLIKKQAVAEHQLAVLEELRLPTVRLAVKAKFAADAPMIVFADELE